MSQTEASEVMELWERRQREDAARQAMVTIHDVAEATQLSPQEIQALLRDVRTRKTEPVVASHVVQKHSNIELWPAILKVLPLTIIQALVALLIMSITNNNGASGSLATMAMLCVGWIVFLMLGYAMYGLSRLYNDAQKMRAMRRTASDQYRDRQTR
jgi:hypothetical protein